MREENGTQRHNQSAFVREENDTQRLNQSAFMVNIEQFCGFVFGYVGAAVKNDEKKEKKKKDKQKVTEYATKCGVVNFSSKLMGNFESKAQIFVVSEANSRNVFNGI